MPIRLSCTLMCDYCPAEVETVYRLSAADLTNVKAGATIDYPGAWHSVPVLNSESQICCGAASCPGTNAG
jgi:hypothetical protein